MLFQSSPTCSSLLAVLFPTPAVKPSLCRAYKLSIEGLIPRDAVASAQLYHCREGTMIRKPWTLCVPNAQVQNQTGRLQELLPSTLEGIKTCSQNDPTHNRQQKASESPCYIWDLEAFLTSSLGTPIPSSFQKAWNPCCCAYRHFLHQWAERVMHNEIKRGAAQNSQALCSTKETSFFSRPSTQKRCLLSGEALMLSRALMLILGGSIIERIKSSREASYLPSPPHTGSCLKA